MTTDEAKAAFMALVDKVADLELPTVFAVHGGHVEHRCESCSAIGPADWSEARAAGWAFTTISDGEGHLLCPDCVEPE